MMKMKYFLAALLLVPSLVMSATAQAQAKESRGGFRGDRAGVGSAVSSDADVAYCTQRWSQYDPVTGKAMNDDGQWHICRVNE